ncbi:MAG: hypothetical protein ACKOEQ_00740 [Verrucomicrobiota bacterium]
MNWASPITLFVAGWLAAFAQTQFSVLRGLLGVPLALGPALVVYAAFTHGLATASLFAVLLGLWTDALSGSRLGLGSVTPFLATFFLSTRQHLLLREQRYAQFWLGLGLGLALPLGHGLLLQAAHSGPALGWHSARQLLVLGLLNGAACPACFWAFDRLRQSFEYPAAPTSFMAGQREMKRGRS